MKKFYNIIKCQKPLCLKPKIFKHDFIPIFVLFNPFGHCLSFVRTIHLVQGNSQLRMLLGFKGFLVAAILAIFADAVQNS